MEIDRHHRQKLLPPIGPEGQAKLRAARLLVVGCGALGSMVCEWLCRAGVGLLRIVDRDVVEFSNLQRQSLFEQSDAELRLPKVEAAAKRLRAIDANVKLDPRAIDIDSTNIEANLDGVDLVVDGTDNAETRYLLNDACVKRHVPWVMGGVIGVEGRVMPVVPGRACLRCVFEMPPSPGELATCDSAGVLNAAVGVVASLQAALAIRLIVEPTCADVSLVTLDVWSMRFRSISISDAKRHDCPCCAKRQFEFLDRTAGDSARLCGRNAVQIRPPRPTRLDLQAVANRLMPIADVVATQLMLKLVLKDRPELALSLFADGRMIVFGTGDKAVARSVYSRVVGD